MITDIVIVSLGPGDPDLLNQKTLRAIRESETLILRTGRHPLSSWLKENDISFSTLDFLYEESDDFDLLNQNVADYLIRQAKSGPIVYAVPDAATDRTVRALLQEKPETVSAVVVPGVSLYDEHISASLSFLQDNAVTVVPADELSDSFHYDPNTSLLVTELDNPILAGQVKQFLSDMLGDEHIIYLLREGHEAVSFPLFELDRRTEIDHRSAVLIPGSGLLERSRFSFGDLETLMEKLRSPDGCPWDRIQTHESLRPYVVEEAWECVACIDQEDPDHLCEELGDLLFQVVFHSSVGRSFGEFCLHDVVTAICSKMIHRHPHVFGSRVLKDPDSVRNEWEQLKQEETGNRSVISSLDDVSSSLPSLKYAAKIMKKLKGTSAVRSDSEAVLSDIEAFTASLRNDSVPGDADLLGRLLLLCSELCFIFGEDSELILHQAVDRLKNRLKSVDQEVKNDGKSLEHLTFEELGVYLNHVEDEIE
ncbi:MAG: MazG family protein [Clostridia bacterium]|nr:MazG family protein [Clostridia bacterium]